MLAYVTYEYEFQVKLDNLRVLNMPHCSMKNGVIKKVTKLLDEVKIFCDSESDDEEDEESEEEDNNSEGEDESSEEDESQEESDEEEKDIVIKKQCTF